MNSCALSWRSWKRFAIPGGEVLAPADGVVTACYVCTGQMTSETTALLLADSSQGWRFTAEVTREQSKYIGTGDKVQRVWKAAERNTRTYPSSPFLPRMRAAR